MFVQYSVLQNIAQCAKMSTTKGEHAKNEREKEKMTRCVKCEVVETYYGFTITREEDKKFDPFTFETYGRATVFYVVNDGEDMLESFKTLKDAKKWIEKIL